jgi:[ribosomal protein S5]-alanine N-acetyltransferase
MEAMPYRDDARSWDAEQSHWAARGCDMPAHVPPVVVTDWRAGLPQLHRAGVTLRELRRSDAASLCALLTTEEVSRFISPPPTTVEAFERFIDWTVLQRAAGTFVCFAVVPTGCDAAVGLFQIRASNDGFSTAEWGFALGMPHWGTGIFAQSAELVLEFAFATLGIHRLEARAAVENGRGNAALRKLGAVREAVLRRSLQCRGQQLDQALWTLIGDEWRLRQSYMAERTCLIH